MRITKTISAGLIGVLFGWFLWGVVGPHVPDEESLSVPRQGASGSILPNFRKNVSLEDWKRLPLGADIDSRFQALNRTPWFSNKGREFSKLFEELAAIDTQKAIQLAASVDGRLYEEKAWGEIFWKLLSEAEQKDGIGMRATADLAAQHFPGVMAQVLDRWFAIDPQSALDYFEHSRFATDEDLTSVLVQDWGRRDPARVTQWLAQATLPKVHDRDEWLIMALSAGSQSNPNVTTDLAQQYLEGSSLKRFLRGASREWAQVNPKVAIEWGRSLEPELRVDVLRMLADALAYENPGIARDLLPLVSGREDKRVIVSKIAGSMTAKEGLEAAKAWAVGLSDPEYVYMAHSAIASQLAQGSLEDATAFVLASPASDANRAAMLQRVASNLAAVDAAYVRQWMTTLPSKYRPTID